jgi:ubiquitin carboxyl-terminal hydrolase 47
MTPEFRKSVY